MFASIAMLQAFLANSGQIRTGGGRISAAYGFCRDCEKNHSIPTTEAARSASRHLVRNLETAGRVDFDCMVAPADSSLSVARLIQEKGKMMGVLVATDVASGSTVVLKAFSGKLGGRWEIPGWAPSIYVGAPSGDPENIYPFSSLQQEVAALMLMEKEAEASGQRGKAAALKLDRQAASRRALAELRKHQLVTNFRGETRAIASTHLLGESKVPVGTGDCCVIKLIAWAQRLGLRPESTAEFFFGARARAHTRVSDGEYYDACEPRCQPVLGFLLCGHQEKMGDLDAPEIFELNH